MSNLILPIYVFCTSAGLIFLKLGSSSGLPISFAGGRLVFNMTLFSSMGLILYFVSFILYVYLISKFQLGYIIPVSAALVYVVVFTASYFVFNEPFTAVKILGIGLIITGLILVNQFR